MREQQDIKNSAFYTQKIGIVTRYDDNYGACLQAAALQHKLQELGYSAEIIKYSAHSGQLGQSVAFRHIRILSSIKLKKAFFIFLSRKYVLARKRAFTKFRNAEIVFSKEDYISAADMAELADKYEAFICGSDMIWCEEFLDSLQVYFLRFAPRSKRIAYSPSFGRGILAKENVPTYRQWISEMGALSCREQSGVKLIEELTGKRAVHTVDPTLLLTMEEWKEVSNRAKKIQTSAPYLLTYLFSKLTKNGKVLVKRICDSMGLEHRSIPSTLSEYMKEERLGIVGHGPYEFVNLYLNANFIVTNTYHGLIFALIFHKPFIVLKRDDSGKWAKYDDRLVDLLTKLGLEERYISQNAPFDERWLSLDYSQVNSMIEEWRFDSVSYLKKALISSLNSARTDNALNVDVSVLKNPPIKNYSIARCVGCGACKQICPASSISMIVNCEGFLFPECDYKTCISCGLCDKVCQINGVSGSENEISKDTFVAISKKKEIWQSAASGGAAGTFAFYAINNMNALVVGCSLNTDMCAKHTAITKTSEVEAIQGSKYVQSDIGNSYKIIRDALHDEQFVLFFGTPCQVVGLQKFLGKAYEKLITVDHVCHGVPSPGFFKKCTDYYNKQGNIKSLKFRKKVGIPRRSSVYILIIEYENGKVIRLPAKCDAYYSMFMNGLDFRESCYSCKYAKTTRYADITIGDCDSASRYPEFFRGYSKSIILLNTTKGKLFWDAVKYLFEYRKLDLKAEVEKNEQLRKPYDRSPARDIVYKKVSLMSYNEINRKYAVPFGWKKRLSVLLQDLLPNWLYHAILSVIS